MSYAIETQPQKPIKKQGQNTTFGKWRCIDDKDGNQFREFCSHWEWLDRPFICMRWGRDPETGKMATAFGCIAIGQRASGLIAIGQFVNGGISIGQFATGRVFALGQFAVAPVAIGHFSIALAAIGQSGLAGWGIFQQGITVFAGLGQNLLNLIY